MRRDLLEILACPVCRGALTLGVEKEDAREIVTGSLQCAACNESYPIKDSIPNILPPDMREDAAP
jgi:uncharacterized protein YbaR (Trm112 family)